MRNHTHKFELKRPNGTVRICSCGKWQHSEHAGPSIVEQPLFPGPIQTDTGDMVNVKVNPDGTLSI